MPDIPLPEDLSSYVRDLERRIRTLETAPRAQDTTQPWQSNIIDGTFSTSSTVDVDSVPPGPSITIRVGQSGRALVSASAYIGLNTTNQSGFVALYIDGVPEVDIVGLSNNNSAMAANVASSRVVTGLSEGSHTFLLKYRVTTGTGNFSSRSLIVQPF